MAAAAIALPPPSALLAPHMAPATLPGAPAAVDVAVIAILVISVPPNDGCPASKPDTSFGILYVIISSMPHIKTAWRI
ncbi:hypothetical protein [Pectinatus frisingensis]|uniref:hypothetical protein n=1 Tax=Pectinatus frisingensis TaxID=865 RepID=UPI003D804DC1